MARITLSGHLPSGLLWARRLPQPFRLELTFRDQSILYTFVKLKK